MAFEAEQLEVCRQHDAVALPTLTTLKVGISQSALDGVLPLNGLRHPPVGDTSGWYIWGGEELPEGDNFFLPMHIYHLHKQLPKVVKYLFLPPSWRFLIGSGNYEDVWVDEALLES